MYSGLTVKDAADHAKALDAAIRGRDWARAERLSAANVAWFASELDWAEHAEAFRHRHLRAAQRHWERLVAREAMAHAVDDAGRAPGIH